jgi:hypothetical protein
MNGSNRLTKQEANNVKKTPDFFSDEKSQAHSIHFQHIRMFNNTLLWPITVIVLLHQASGKPLNR